MLQYIDADGRLILRDRATAGHPILLDTDDGNLFVDPADYFSGSISLPARSASSSGVSGPQGRLDLTAEYYVATPSSPSANIVLGQMRRSTDAAWRSAWGTRILDFDAVGNTFVPQTDLVSQNYLATVRAVTPLINPLGHLVLRERTIIRPRDPGSPPTITKTLPALTLDYRLFCGGWWGNPFQAPRADANLTFGGAVGFVSSTLSIPVFVGYPYPGRRVGVVIQNALNAPNPTAFSVGATPLVIHGTVATANTRTTIASAVIETGENFTLTVNNYASTGQVNVYVYAVRSLTGDPPTIYTTSTASGVSTNLSLPESEAAVALIFSTRNGSNNATCDWSGATETADQVAGNFANGQASTAIIEGLGAVDVTSTWSGAAAQISMLAAVFT